MAVLENRKNLLNNVDSGYEPQVIFCEFDDFCKVFCAGVDLSQALLLKIDM